MNINGLFRVIYIVGGSYKNYKKLNQSIFLFNLKMKSYPIPFFQLIFLNDLLTKITYSM